MQKKSRIYPLTTTVLRVLAVLTAPQRQPSLKPARQEALP